MATHTDPMWCDTHKQYFDVCSKCLRVFTGGYDPLKEGYQPLPDSSEGKIKPPQGGTGETLVKICKHCGMDIAIRNPSGHCDHLYYPENCTVCKSLEGLLKDVEIDGDKIRDMLPDLIDEHFPKHECKERGQAIVLASMLYIKILDMQPIKRKEVK
jgi:hypothetical protein